MNPTLSKTNNNNNIHLIEELPTPLSNRVVGDHTSDARREILFPPTCQHVNANPWAWKQHGKLLLYVPIERNEYEPGTQESQTRHRWINGARTRDPWKPKLSPDSHYPIVSKHPLRLRTALVVTTCTEQVNHPVIAHQVKTLRK